MNSFLAGYLFLFSFWLAPPWKPSTDKGIINKLADYSWSHPQEKVYLHTDKSVYVPGEDIWLKAYLMLGPYQIPDTLSNVLYVELINPEGTLSDRKILHIRRGLGWGDFHLPMSTAPGRYILKAYTRYMENYDADFLFRKEINVLPLRKYDTASKNDKKASQVKANSDFGSTPINIQFFPEGGHLVENLQSYVAFKATNRRGSGIPVKGILKNSLGNIVTEFESQKFGLGLFAFKPAEGEVYRANISSEGVDGEFEYQLPNLLKKGYVMHINKTRDKVLIRVENNMGATMNDAFVIAHFRGFPFATLKAKPDQDFLYRAIDVGQIPCGIIQFTFFDALGVPQCERLLFNENEKDRITFEFNSNKKNYTQREKAFFYLHSEDLNADPILSNISVSITNTSTVPADENKSQIISYFNLESDLKGDIENPGYYFNAENTDRHEMLDILMLTHGWRRFEWKEILIDQAPSVKYPAEAGFNIEGGLVDFYNPSKIGTGFVRLFIYEGQFYYNEIATDEHGHFQFSGIDIYDSTQVVLQAWRPPGNPQKRKKNKPPEKRNDLTIRIHNPLGAMISPEYWPHDLSNNADYTDFIAQNEFILQIDSSFEGKTIMMDEITINSEKIEDTPFDRPGKLYKEPNNRLVMDSLYVGLQSLSILELIRDKIPGVQVTGFPPDVQIMIRGPKTLYGNTQPLILLDGIEVDAEFIYNFPTTEIAFVDVLKGGKAAVYGGQAANGVIAIYTRTEPVSYEQEGRRGMHNFVHPGYYRAREFYTPNYEIPDESHVKPDYRRVLYWNPSLTTDDLGNAKFYFHTSDEAAEYRVEIEGMTYSGIPFTHEYFFTVE